MRKILGLLAIALCGLASVPADAQPAKDVLTIDLPNDAATLDPHLQWDTDSYAIYRNMFSNLLTRDQSGKIVPQIATAWRYIDGSNVEFDIRTDVVFHDGSRLTAEDVVFSVKRIIDPALKSSQLSQFDQIAEAQVVGPAKVRLRTKGPYPVLFAQLVKLSIVPKAYVQRVGDQEFNVKPIGSGPYKLREWQKGVRVVLDADERHWAGKPPFKTVIFRAVPEVATRVADLRTGQADLIRLVPADEAIEIKKDARLQVLAVPTERIGYIFLNAQSGPTADVRVRRAIAHAIDRQGLIDALLQGYGAATEIVGAPIVFGHTPDVKGYPYDPARAKELLKEAGAEGAALTFLTSPAYDRRMVEALQQMIRDVGLNVQVVTLDHATFLRRRQGNPDEAGNLAFGQWSCACQDADGIIFPLFRSGNTWAKYENAAYNVEVDAARTTLDEAERLRRYKRAYEILREDVPGVGLFQSYAIYAARRELRWQPTPNESFFVADMMWRP